MSQKFLDEDDGIGRTSDEEDGHNEIQSNSNLTKWDTFACKEYSRLAED